MLLQYAYFTPDSLQAIARQLDEMENNILGNNANAVGRSENMNDSGYFSIQVIEKALDAFSLKLTNIENPEMVEIKQNPLTAKAFICNLEKHWFVLRKFGAQWFELNSVKHGPRLLSDTYVQEFLHQLAAENYSIFVVQGILPECEADKLIAICPVEVKKTPKKEPEGKMQKFFNTVGRRLGGATDVKDSQEDKDLAIAMAMSMETQETDLEKAILMSLGASETPILGSGASGSSLAPSEEPPKSTNAEQQRRDREKFLERVEKKKN
uniref:Ataxin-3 homolog n=1 Tax=Caenorhabditis tropicalis TaxID=1561998 RepID=A0A1I7UEJ6_9PELO